MKGFVRSSWGTFEIDMDTGAVISYEPIDQGFGDPLPVRFDLDEYFACYTKEGRAQTVDFDVLDVGYWCVDGTYEGPEPHFRARVAEGMSSIITNSMDGVLK